MKKKIIRGLIITCMAMLVTVWAIPADAAISRDVVNEAWVRITAAAGMEYFPIVFESETAPNAWVRFESSSRFSVHVTEGLMQLLQTSDEIAGVLGHEVGHIQLGHFNRRLTRNVGWAIAGTVLSRVGAVAEVVGAVGMGLAEGGFSREQEVEADDFGADLAIRAGYSPWGLHNAMIRFRDGGFRTERGGFNSHPPTDRRLERLANRARDHENNLAAAQSQPAAQYQPTTEAPPAAEMQVAPQSTEESPMDWLRRRSGQ